MPRVLPSSGSTLLEMLVMLGVIGLLSVVFTPTLMSHVIASKEDRVAADLRAIGQASRMFYVQVERWPSSIEQLVEGIDSSDEDLFGRPFPSELADGWTGPYLMRRVVHGSVQSAAGSTINVALDTVSWNGSHYLRVAVGDVTQQTARSISRALDGDTIVGRTGLENDADRVRWKHAAGADSLIFLAVAVH